MVDELSRQSWSQAMDAIVAQLVLYVARPSPACSAVNSSCVATSHGSLLASLLTNDKRHAVNESRTHVKRTPVFGNGMAKSASPWCWESNVHVSNRRRFPDCAFSPWCISRLPALPIPSFHSYIHYQIRKSEKNLLERLFTVIHHMTPNQMEGLLREDEPIIEKRKGARACLEDVKTAIFQVGGGQGYRGCEKRPTLTQTRAPPEFP